MIFYLIILFILGSAVGSFLNVIIDRTIRRETILGRSHCDHCLNQLSSIDLVPIFSFLMLGAHCRYCHKAISWQYPAVELTTALLFPIIFYSQVNKGDLSIITLLYSLFIISTLLVVAVIDLKVSLIPTTLVFIASLVSLFFQYFNSTSYNFVINVFSALAFTSIFLIIVLITRGRGMGTGDIPLVFLIGIFLGWPENLVSIFASFATGGLVSTFLLILGKKSIGQTIPFGPFIVLGTICSFFFSQVIINWYSGIL